MNQVYNKTIVIKHFNTTQIDTNFNLNNLVYLGKITSLADYFNKLSITDVEKIIFNEENMESLETKEKSSLQIAAYLNFPNIFLYLLTFNSNAYYIDGMGQSVWHVVLYKGHNNIQSLLLNYERFKLKMEFLINIDEIKKSHGFSKLDILNGKLSKAVYMTETNIKKFSSLQKKIKEVTDKMIRKFISKLELGLIHKDNEGRTPLHYAAMSKFPLCHLTLIELLDFEFFKLPQAEAHWNEFLHLFQDIQNLEIKDERIFDPRKSMRLERELLNIMGEDIIKTVSKEYKKQKFELVKKVINTGDNMNDTVLHVASFHGDYRIVNKLLDYGANKTALNSNNKMPVDLAKDNYVRKSLTNLNKAAKNSDVKNVTELVNFGHNINEKISIFSQAPIHKVIESNKKDKYETLKKMLDMGADPNCRDSNGWTSLHYACRLGDIESVEILFKNKADIYAYSNNHRTALHLASAMNFPKIVLFLLGNNADPNCRDSNGCTPIHLAAKHGNTECIALLLDSNANLYEEDFRKWNILHYAAFQGHKLSVRFITKYDSDFDILQNSRNSQNKLPIEIVRDPSVKPFFVSLWHSAKQGDLDMTRQLLNDGENINEVTTFMKNTPLHLAVLNNHYLLVRLLLENKANVDVRNQDGITAIEYADIIQFAIKMHHDKEIGNPNVMNEFFDLRNIVRNVLNKNEKVLNSTIFNKNWKIRFWNLNDFNCKICFLFGSYKIN